VDKKGATLLWWRGQGVDVEAKKVFVACLPLALGVSGGGGGGGYRRGPFWWSSSTATCAPLCDSHMCFTYSLSSPLTM